MSVGIAGEIRTRLVRYRSKQETSEDYYPRIESARDSFGNIYTIESASNLVSTETKLRPGDTIEFVVTASDPLGENIEYQIKKYGSIFNKWQKSNLLSIRITEKDVQKSFMVDISIRSRRKFHARGDDDDWVKFFYEVLPPKNKIIRKLLK